MIKKRNQEKYSHPYSSNTYAFDIYEVADNAIIPLTTMQMELDSRKLCSIDDAGNYLKTHVRNLFDADKFSNVDILANWEGDCAFTRLLKVTLNSPYWKICYLRIMNLRRL